MVWEQMKTNFIIFICLVFLLPVNIDSFWVPSYPTITDTPVTQRFGAPGPKLPHVGVDFTLYVGSPVYAVMTGRVISAEIDRVYGRYIMIEHLDGYASLYGHLSEIKVRVGDWIRSGKLIGLSGGDPSKDPEGAGWSIIPHLHFEIRVPEHLDNNLYNIDPMEYLGFNDEE